MSQSMDTTDKGGQRRRSNSTPIINGITCGIEIVQIEHTKEKERNMLEVEKPKERKRSRTDDDSEVDKMEIIKDVTDENMCIVETRVISGLIENIDENNVRALIESFNPIIRSSPDHIKQTMLECSEWWESGKNTYIGAINYMAQGRQEKSSIEEKLEEKSLEELCEILIREIENRMPKHCGQCDEYYMVQLKNTPMIYCMWCKVGMHDCMENNKGIGNIKGIKWLCNACDPVFTKHILPKMDPVASFEGFEIKKALSVKKNAIPNETNKKGKKQNDKGKGKKDEDEVEVSKSIDSEKSKKPEDPNKINEEENKEEPMDVEKEPDVGNKVNDDAKKNKDTKDKATPKEICWFWKNRKCRYTINCKQHHPEQCKDILETGRCRDSRCNLVHPKICRNLFFKGYCHRGESCWYIHPSKCPNNQPNNMMNQNANNNNNNQFSNDNNQQNNRRNTSPNFLGMWPTLPSQNNQQNNRMNQNLSMIQMMQNMMDKLTQMDNKIIHLERGQTRMGKMEMGQMNYW